MRKIISGLSAEENTDLLEQQRQERYMEAAREKTAALAARLHRTPTCHVTNFGCQMNAKDAEKLLGILLSAGFEETQDEAADFLIYNTCTVRDNADQRVFGRLGRVSHYRKNNPDMKIALCGCMMQEDLNVEKVLKSYPFVDLIFGTHNLFRFPEYLAQILDSGERIVDIWKKTDRIVESLPSERKYSFKSGVNITFGCDNFCSYCIVPYVRGRERSRRPEEILGEIRALSESGVKEIMLLGQNVNSYGRGLDEPCTFAELIDRAAKIDGIRRIRFMTPHPKDFSDELIEVIKRNENIARHVHLPLQSGSTQILKQMNRKYTKEQYLALAEKIRTRLPDAAITTDIIVGFPGETDRDVDDTIDVIRRVHFDNAYTFIYSKRTGTPAARMEDPATEEEKKDRFSRVLQCVQQSAKERALLLQGKVMTGLVEEVNTQSPGKVTARLSDNMIVHIDGDESMIGKFYPIRLNTCCGFYYFGETAGEEIV
ncbi:MAG: tRNA (N6-isopentenyl adenosine(37)-C2)-methylthiotransferase MiaB [Lachnospiraceae bacterium]|nr:tRNA (N6-isopentenyl adenosine(37)-C2)-methylthiotransferase MiaB [Lachnospiraceae bacterium]